MPIADITSITLTLTINITLVHALTTIHATTNTCLQLKSEIGLHE